MYLEIKSRSGHFNWADPSQESISTSIVVVMEDGSRKATSLTTEYDETEVVPEVSKAVALLEECIEKIFIDTSRKQKEELLGFLKAHKQEINQGTVNKRIEFLKKQIIRNQEEINSLEKAL